MHASQQHQAGKKKTDQQAFFQNQGALVLRVSLGEAQEEEKNPHEHHGMMRKDDNGSQKQKMNYTHQPWNADFRVRNALLSFAGDMGAKQKGNDSRIDQDCKSCLPSKMRRHMNAIPMPGGSHHQHRRRGKRGQRATDGDIHKEHAESAVFQPLRDPLSKHLRSQHECGQRHGSRLGNQRTDEWHERKAEPYPRDSRVHGNQRSDRGNEALHCLQNRLRRSHDHDDEHEERFCILTRFRIFNGLLAAGDQRHCDKQNKGPEPEDHFDFAEQVKQAGVIRMAIGKALK